MEDDNGNEADGEVTHTGVITASSKLVSRTGLYGLGLHIARFNTYITCRILGYIDPSLTAA